ncbi:MAG: hypothetical protein FWG12_05345 [Holophagaceae bacterium]|nr:hypothetical protein [Holophagaceae bacterium]
MLFRLVAPLLFSLAASAQQDSVNFEIHSTGFPSEMTNRLNNLRLKFIAADAQKMTEAGRAWPIKEDNLAEMVSTNKFSWTITYSANGVAKISGRQSVAFKFPSTFPEFNNASYFLDLVSEGLNWNVRFPPPYIPAPPPGGRIIATDTKGNIVDPSKIPTSFTRKRPMSGFGSPFVPEATYVLVIRCEGGLHGESGEFDIHFITKDKLEDALSGKLYQR